MTVEHGEEEEGPSLQQPGPCPCAAGATSTNRPGARQSAAGLQQRGENGRRPGQNPRGKSSRRNWNVLGKDSENW